MQARTVTLAVQYLRLMADQLRAVGGSVEYWLSLSGFQPADLDDPSFELTWEQFQRLVLDAVAIADEPGIGLLLGQRLVPSTHGALGYAVLNGGTLREVLDLTQRFISLRAGFVGLTFEEAPEHIRVIISEPFPLGQIRNVVLDAVVLTIKQAAEAVARGSVPIREAYFPYRTPGYADLAEDLFGCPVRYGQPWAGFTIAPGVLDLPLKMADPEGLRVAEDLCQRELDRLASHTTYDARVRRLLLERRRGFPSLPATARMLHLTSRTLHRRLVEEGTSYREILEDLRHRSALDQLAAGHASIDEISYVLGYANPANFRRAFKRWTGVAPSVYRAQALEELPASS